MKLRTTFVLLIVLAGLYAFVKYYKWPTTRDLEEEKNRIVIVDREKIDGITITNNETKIELRKRDGQWFMDAPVKDRAETSTVEQLLGSAEMLKAEDTIRKSDKGGKDNIKDYGLATPAVRVKFLGKESTPEILFGKDTAVTGKIYARLDNSETAYIITNELKNQVTKKTDEFRDHRLTALNMAQITRAEIKTPAGQIELEKKSDHWQINKPLNTRGDDQKISDLVAGVVNARIEKFVPENEAKAAATGLAEPRGTLSLFIEGKEKPVILQVGQPPEGDKEKLYAKLSTRDGIYVLKNNIGGILDTKPNDIRDRHLLRFNLDTVDRINIEPAGGKKIVLARKEENWILKGQEQKPANSGEVRRLAANLQSAEVVAFVADTASDLAKYGLDKPQVKLTLSAYASENTAETKAGEMPIVGVLFGRVEGGNVYAKLDTEPFVVSVNKALFDSIATDAIRWRDLAVFQAKPAEIGSLEIAKPDHPPVSLVRDKGQWSHAKGGGELNKINVDTLVNALAGLRAVRWGGAPAPEQGFDKPAVKITFTAGDKKPHKLVIGAKTPEGMWFAMADEPSTVFVVNDPDASALQIQLMQSALPAASPKQGASPSPAPPAAMPATIP